MKNNLSRRHFGQAIVSALSFMILVPLRSLMAESPAASPDIPQKSVQPFFDSFKYPPSAETVAYGQRWNRNASIVSAPHQNKTKLRLAPRENHL